MRSHPGAGADPSQGRSISQAKTVSALRNAGRERNLELKAAEIQGHLRAPQLEVPPMLTQAYGRSFTASVRLLHQMNQELTTLERELAANFEMHPDAETYLSLPGLGFVLGARVLAEFGDDRTRFDHPKARKSYAGNAPITKASGRHKVVLARVARNRRLADASYLWAFASLTRSQGARRYYDQLRGRGKPTPPSPSRPRQPSRRHPPRLHHPSRALPRGRSLAGPRSRRLTSCDRGMCNGGGSRSLPEFRPTSCYFDRAERTTTE